MRVALPTAATGTVKAALVEVSGSDTDVVLRATFERQEEGLDPERNRTGAPGRISRSGFRGAYVFETHEERLTARAAAAALGGAKSP